MLGIDTAAGAFADIALWSKEQETRYLLDSLEWIKGQAQSMYTELTEQMKIPLPLPYRLEAEEPPSPKKVMQKER